MCGFVTSDNAVLSVLTLISSQLFCFDTVLLFG